MNKINTTCSMLALLLLSGCITNDQQSQPASAGSTPKIEKVFFAQHHVLEPTNPLFKLVGGLGALIKVQVYADTPTPSPLVFATLELDSKTKQIPLRGPKMLPRRPTCDPILMEQSYDDSFTAMIPKEWVKTGLKVTLELKDYDYTGVDADDSDYSINTSTNCVTLCDRMVLDQINIGAPTKVVMQMFDIHYFSGGKGADFPEGWETELEAKLPVAELVVHRVKNIMFNEIVMPPMFDKPSAKYTSLEDFKEKTGHEYDGEQGIALRWCAALKAAGGRFGLWRPYNINIAGVYSGGQAGGYRSCANLHRHGVLIHELGHTFGLPHWLGHKDYPYTRTMYGKDQGEPEAPNAGPSWAFDVSRREFLSPRETLPDGTARWTRDPMQGGGRSNMKTYLYKHFSDYSVNRMRNRFENQAAYWNEDTGQYAQWNQETGAYDKIIKNDGLLFPIERDVDVISLMASANLAVPDANIIYAPIGPYKAGLISRFDADSAQDREAAQRLGYTDETCSVCLRVTQGGKVKTYLMTAKVSPDDDPLTAFNVSAINLPARDGEVTKAELLYAPDVITKGLNANSKVLYTWNK